ncbi:MAG: tripartite tricarboxylate transporter substrate binding protein [Betaproteobacteria bacterium]|nr:tripartite tricarboxylate transporter substrate binding protein [Betaproteobacteria bacterium]MBI3056850.1 tripartite tricarboxylate transporter substrate binding protein [Betaproteobacteria bacterium]
MKLAIAIAFAAAALASTGAPAQSYPQKTVRVVVPYAPGGNTDFTARVIAAKLTDVFGQQIVVENRPGGGTNIGSELVAKAPADGYTLLMGGASNAINMSFYPKMPYDTLRDFAPVILCVKGANVLSVHPSLPAKNLQELIALAKTRPGQLNYASSGLGSSNMMAGELLKLMAGVNIVHVPYKGNSPALTDTIGGQVEMIFSGVPALLPHIKSGRLRAIAIGSLKRFPALPDVPTIDASGLKGYEATTWFGLMAPAKTPKDIVARLNSEFGRILVSTEVHDRFMNEGIEPIGGTPEQFGAFIRDEIDKYAKVVKATNLRAQ